MCCRPASAFAFALLLFVMLLGALNYANNPALLLTCLFGAACGASLFAGFRAMNGLTLLRASADECHAGAPLSLHLRFAPSTRARPSLRLRHDNIETAFALAAADAEGDVTMTIATTRRGWLRPGRIRVSTEYPLGLFHIWSWLNPDAEFLVYPAPESPAPPLPGGGGNKAEQARAGTGEDHAGLRDYRVTDPPRLIAWKASARHESLLVRDAERRSDDALVLDYAVAARPRSRSAPAPPDGLGARCGIGAARIRSAPSGPDDRSRHRRRAASCVPARARTGARRCVSRSAAIRSS